MNEAQPYLQPIAIIGALALMLRYMVVSKLTEITKGIGAHELRIRRLENRSERLHGALSAKGCMAAEICPLIDNDGGDED